MIYNKKVVRTEIQKYTEIHYKIIAPAIPEKLKKYDRKNIDIIYDEISHGVQSYTTPRTKQLGQ